MRNRDGGPREASEPLDSDLVNVDMEDTSVKVTSMHEDGLNGPREGGPSSEQEQGGEGKESDFKLLPKDAVNTDSDSEPDLPPDNDEDIDSGDVLRDTAELNVSLARKFLENT
jgi:hypothetical protein